MCLHSFTFEEAYLPAWRISWHTRCLFYAVIVYLLNFSLLEKGGDAKTFYQANVLNTTISQMLYFWTVLSDVSVFNGTTFNSKTTKYVDESTLIFQTTFDVHELPRSISPHFPRKNIPSAFVTNVKTIIKDFVLLVGSINKLLECQKTSSWLHEWEFPGHCCRSVYMFD